MSLKDFSLNWTVKEVDALTEDILKKANKETDEIVESKDSTFSFAGTFGKFHHSEAIVSEWACKIVLASMVHTKPETRNICNRIKVDLKAWFDARYMRKELFKVLEKSFNLKKNELPEIEKRLAEKTLLLFKRNGVGLDDEKRLKLGKLRQDIAKAETEFQKNLGEDQSYEKYSAEELKGCPGDFLASLVKDQDGKYIVTTKPPHVRIVNELCEVEKTRKNHLKVTQGRCPENAELLCNLVKLRAETANLLGYKTWNEYKIEPTMANKEENIWQLLAKLTNGLEEKLDNDLEKLKSLKFSETVKSGFYLWDIAYYEKKFLKEKCNLDEQKIRQYLPMDFCIRKVIQIYEFLFGITFISIEDLAFKWHEEVLLFAVNDTKSKENLGYFYLDLFARPGKYAHQCVIPLAPCFQDGDVFKVPIVANISNLSSKSNTGTAALSHGELTTFFHEFGHAVHALTCKSPYSTFSWSWNAVPYPAGVEMDFLEVPSKSFENWGYEKKVLKSVTHDVSKLGEISHKEAQKTSEPQQNAYSMPEDFIDQIQKTRFLFSGYDYRRMAFMSAFDLVIHGIPYNGNNKIDEKFAKSLLPSLSGIDLSYCSLNVDSMLKLWSSLQSHFVKMETVEGTNPLANWYHMAMGYDSGYFGYLWSEGVGADIYKTFFEKDCLNTKAGATLREKILSKGATEDAEKMVYELLGRKVNVEILINRLL